MEPIASEPSAPLSEPPRDWSTPVVIFVLGLAEVLIVYLLLVLDTPVAPFVRRAAETAVGRVVIALIGFVVISFGMIIFLTLLERRRKGRDRASAVCN